MGRRVQTLHPCAGQLLTLPLFPLPCATFGLSPRAASQMMEEDTVALRVRVGAFELHGAMRTAAGLSVDSAAPREIGMVSA